MTHVVFNETEGGVQRPSFSNQDRIICFSEKTKTSADHTAKMAQILNLVQMSVELVKGFRTDVFLARLHLNMI